MQAVANKQASIWLTAFLHFWHAINRDAFAVATAFGHGIGLGGARACNVRTTNSIAAVPGPSRIACAQNAAPRAT